MAKRYICLILSIASLTLVQVRAAHGAYNPLKDPALVGWWTFDEGSGALAQDSSANANNGTVAGGVTWIPGVYGTALNFNGTDAYVGTGKSLLNNVADFTMAGWVMARNAGSSRIGLFGQNDLVEMGFMGGNCEVWSAASGTTNTPWGFANTEWHHIAVIDSGTAMQIYFDGQVRTTGAGAATHATSSYSFNIGGGGIWDDSGNWFDGQIDDVALFHRALAEEEVQVIMLGLTNPAMASAPNPEDEATDVSRDTALSWNPGQGATNHDVYIGTSFDDVNDASQPTESLMDTTYDPEGYLGFGQTYYWRIDETDANGMVFKGEVWSFTVEPYSYPLTDLTVTASSEQGTSPAIRTIDGSGLDNLDQHSTETADMWMSPEGLPAWIQFNFGKVYKLHKLWVWNANSLLEEFMGFGAKDVAIEYSADGNTWTPLENVPQFAQGTGQPTYTPNTIIDLGGVTAKHVRLTINDNWGEATFTSLSEVRFFYVPVRAFKPDPADGATDVSIETTLNWRPGREAVSHEVNLGTDPNALALAGTANVPSFTPEPLTLATTYSWQINEVNEAEAVATWTGTIWSFTTQTCRVVDDFEQYTNNIDAGETIFQTWGDGYEVAENGATVGYTDAPFAETVVVRTGKQAMLLSYDNSTASYSEAQASIADLSIGPDWTIGSPKTLVLWVCGDLSNAAGDRLYVKINSTKVEYPGSLSVPIWKQWNVDLGGINIGNVKTLTIGVDSDGVGRLYIDEIALYRQAPAIVEPGPDSDASMVGHWKLDETAGLIAADSSGYGNDGTLVGMTGNEWKTGIHGGALEFTGTGKYVDCGNDTSLHLRGSVTISTWVKMAPNNAAAYMGIGGKLKTSPYKGFALVRHSSNVFRLWADNGNGEIAGFDASSDKPYTDTEWHHVVGVVDAGTSTLYVDGVKQTKQGSVSLTDSGEVVHIGRQYSGLDDRYWNGLIDDVRIYYRALSAQEIAGL
jgi:hypothetical protein